MTSRSEGPGCYDRGGRGDNALRIHARGDSVSHVIETAFEIAGFDRLHEAQVAVRQLQVLVAPKPSEDW